jgi:predicted dehydrogenase
MNLTPEQKAIGKENFAAALGSKRVRGDFIKKGIQQGIASGKGLGPYYYGYDKEIKDPVRVGVIGTGDEGSVLIGALNPDFVTVKSIADIRPYNVHRAFHGDHYSPTATKVRSGLMAKYGWKTEKEAKENVKVYADYRDLIKAKDDDQIEAVIIALPLHLHAPAAIAAMNAGLHVLTEKLMGHSVRECKEMARVAEDKKVHLATGHQRHYNILYDNAHHMIDKGLLGDIHYIRAQWHRGNLPGHDSWRQAMPKSVKPSDDMASKLAGDLASWEKRLAGLKKASKPNQKAIALLEKKVAQKRMQIEDQVIADKVKEYGYRDVRIESDGKVAYQGPPMEELIRWRLWDRTGGGLMAELGSHQLDAASIFISAMHGGKKQQPLNVMAAANRPLFPANRDTNDHVYCLFEFPAPGFNPDPKDQYGHRRRISVSYASINGNGFGGYGETVFGTNGTLLLETEKEAMLFRGSAVNDKIRVVGNKDKDTKDRHPSTIVSNKDGDPVSAALGAHALAGDISRGYTEEIEHWAWCIRNPDPENKPHCHPKVALADAVIALTTNRAAREGKRIEFKPEWFDPAVDETPEGEKPDISRYA